jgi:acyl-CoA reductase-like NAD-dependent aldehyde dehydrogenase
VSDDDKDEHDAELAESDEDGGSETNDGSRDESEHEADAIAPPAEEPRPAAPAPTPLDAIAEIVRKARRAQANLAALDLAERAALLQRMKRAILSRGDAIARAIIEETGKPEAEAWLHEVLPTADLGDFWSTEGPNHLAPVMPLLDALSYPGKRAVIERVPRGVVALITPWNFPVALPLRTIFPALLAGNAIVLKPSEYTSRSAALVVDAVRTVVGDDLVSIVYGAGDRGDALIRAGVDGVVFTGSVATGKKVAHAAADVLVPVSLELGGNDAAVVLEDADLERTARGIVWGALSNTGQNCAAIERVYAVKSIYEPLKNRVAERMRELVAGRDYGPLTTDAQLAIVESHVRDAKERGAEVVVGGDRLDRGGRWFAPTLLAKVDPGSLVLRDETFGPVLPIVEVSDAVAAVEAANQSRYGLTASVWSKDSRRAERLSRDLKAGVVTINDHAFSGAVPALPWTGRGESGYGITSSQFALDFFASPRTTIVDTKTKKPELWWYPYTPNVVKIAKAMTSLRGGGGIGARAKAVASLPGAFLRRWKT